MLSYSSLSLLLIIPCLSVFIEYKMGFWAKFLRTREDDAMIGLEKAIGNNGTNFGKVAVG